MKSDLKKLLLELDALGELQYGMIEYFESCYDRDKEINPSVILQAFTFIWNAHKEITNKYYPMVNELIKKEEQ